MSRTSPAESQPDRRHHRQPEREKRRKRGACIDPHGYDAGKKIKGKKRHILVDTVGLLLHAIVHPADIQDRDGGALVMATLCGTFPSLKMLFVDDAYKGPKFAQARDRGAPHWLAHPLPPPSQGLGVLQPKGLGILAPRLNTLHAQKTLQSGLKSPDRHLERNSTTSANWR